MSQFRTSADYLDAILTRAGEPTSGTSSFESDAKLYLNKIHHIILAGGSVFDVDIDETWTWARARNPITIELQAPYSTGSVSLTNESEAGTFSAAPAASLKDWHFQITSGNTVLGTSNPEIYRIKSHTAGATAFELDSAFVGNTASAATFKAFKLDYQIMPSYLYVDSTNNKLDFFDGTAQTQLTATLTAGSYTPAQLATHVATQITSPSAANWTGSYDTDTNLFTFTSDLSGGAVRQGWLGATGTNSGKSALALLGFDCLDTAATNTAALAGTYVLGGISRMIEPFRVFGQYNLTIDGVDNLKMADDYPLSDTREGLPTRFTRLYEDASGRIWVRFNRYPKNPTKIEVEHVPVPRDLQDNAVSIPLVPRKYSDILEYGAASFILIDKENDKASTYATLAAKQLKAMQNNNRAELYKTGSSFGEIIPRMDNTTGGRRRLRYGYTADDC